LLLAGGRPRPPAGAATVALTPAEHRIAEIAVEGATNAATARRLYLSPKTVELHLRSTYRKLNLTGRHELAAALKPPNARSSGPESEPGEEKNWR
jgi:DNA-binding CsgD family transcriptional regulator